MLKELQDATVALSEIRFKLQSTGEKLQYTAFAKSQLARGFGNQARDHNCQERHKRQRKTGRERGLRTSAR